MLPGDSSGQVVQLASLLGSAWVAYSRFLLLEVQHIAVDCAERKQLNSQSCNLFLELCKPLVLQLVADVLGGASPQPGEHQQPYAPPPAFHVVEDREERQYRAGDSQAPPVQDAHELRCQPQATLSVPAAYFRTRRRCTLCDCKHAVDQSLSTGGVCIGYEQEAEG